MTCSSIYVVRSNEVHQFTRYLVLVTRDALVICLWCSNYYVDVTVDNSDVEVTRDVAVVTRDVVECIQGDILKVSTRIVVVVVTWD